MVNILVCRLLLEKDSLAMETLLDNHDAYTNSIQHQHCSLADMVHLLQLSRKPLFNTVISIQKDLPRSVEEGAIESSIKPEHSIDATEVSTSCS